MITTVHLIFKTHLDIGYTDFAARVVENYFTSYIPQAIALARQLREEGREERFVWTTGSWLIYEYLEQADSEQRRAMEEAIRAGDIAWHALPFTTHTELMDASLFRAGLRLAQELDARFGVQTIAAKMTDVPGHTRAMVPLLAEAGVRFLHIGVNPASTPPDVPPVFTWRHSDGSELLVMYQKGSYGDVMTVPGLPDAIAFAHTGDNCGPQGPDGITRAFDQLRERFPGARIIASTLDHFARALLQVAPQLPVITEELGDMWIHGGGTDPKKVAQFRALCRLRERWLAEGKVTPDDAAFSAFTRHLLLIPEHTWGRDEKVYLNDFTHYARDEFQALRQQENCRQFEASWAEQRAYVTQAVEALGTGPLAADARRALAELEPAEPSPDGYQPFDLAETLDTAHFRLAINPVTGALNTLVHKASGHAWASPMHPLGLFRYEIFSQRDYDRFMAQFLINMEHTWVSNWAIPDYSKPGMAAAASEHRCWMLLPAEVAHRREAAGDRLLVTLAMAEDAHEQFGCPARVLLELWLPDAAPELHLTLQWFDKPACRLPEACWLTFSPITADPSCWRLEKMGLPISPLEVIRHGNRRLHAVTRGIHYAGNDGTLAIDTPDAPLVAPGAPALLHFDNEPLPLDKGMHINLHNNLWGTNFPMWYEDDAKFRFVLRFGA